PYERRLDEPERAGYEQRRPNALDYSRGDQDLGVRREATAERGRGEDAHADHEDQPASEPVRRRPADQQQGRHAQRVSVDDPLHRRERRTQVALDFRQRHVDHRLIDERERRAQHGDREHPGLNFGAAWYARARADRELVARQCFRIAHLADTRRAAPDAPWGPASITLPRRARWRRGSDRRPPRSSPTMRR